MGGAAGAAQAVRARYEQAVDELVADLRRDRQVLAVALWGSLAYDVVWDRSDIDLTIVVADKPANDPGAGMLCYGGVAVHAMLTTREEFKRRRSGALAGSGWDSMQETARLLFSRDETIDALFEEARTVGARDRAIVLVNAACMVVPTLTKARKWLVAKGDADYAALWALMALQGIARIAVIRAGLAPNREAILQALEADPAFFEPLYFDLLNKKKTKALVGDRLDRLDRFLLDNREDLFGPILDFLAERREPTSAGTIEQHFNRRMSVEMATLACEYLADHGLIEKTSVPVRLTRRSNVEVEGLAFMALPEDMR